MKYALNKHANHVLIKLIKLANIKPYLEEIYTTIV